MSTLSELNKELHFNIPLFALLYRASKFIRNEKLWKHKVKIRVFSCSTLVEVAQMAGSFRVKAHCACSGQNQSHDDTLLVIQKLRPTQIIAILGERKQG